MKNTADGTEEARDYLSYLLRLWRESGQKAAWRASLEDPRTGERLGFASLVDLVAFLENETRSRSSRLVRSDEQGLRDPTKPQR